MTISPPAPLSDHVASFWTYERAAGAVIAPVYEFPSLSPELVLGLRGTIRFDYGGRRHAVRGSAVFGHLRGAMRLDLSDVDRMTVVRFRNRGVASALPFGVLRAEDLVARPYITAQLAFGAGVQQLERHLTAQAPEDAAADLCTWLSERLDRERVGLVSEMGPALGEAASVAALAKLAGCSLSTLERRFRRETGLTPKRFLARDRFRRVLADLFASGSQDWIDYVVRFGFYDQSHFIKEVRRFSGFTPAQLLALPALARLR